MANFYEDNEDLHFYIKKEIDWESLCHLTEDGYTQEDGFKNAKECREFYEEILKLVGDFSANKIAKASPQIDREKLSFEDGAVKTPKIHDEIFQGIKDLEIHGMCLPRELSGLNIPLLVYMINGELISRGDVSTMTHHSFHGGIAMALLVYSIGEGSTQFSENPRRLIKTRFEKAIRDIARGEAFGSMDITEPDAGSDMARLRTRGELSEDGVWRLYGQKIFITSGHGQYHIVIAKTENKAAHDPFLGLQNLSLFLVEQKIERDGKVIDNITIDGLEEKIGHHGSATVTLGFNGSEATLIGKRGEGFKLMLTIMNNARVAVGFESLGLCESAYRMAKEYAENRPSMGKMIAHHEMIADYLDEMAIDIKAIRALCMKSAFHEEMYQKKNLLLLSKKMSASEKSALEKEVLDHKALSRGLTPLLKYYAAEKAVEIARKNLQIHGGSGYTTEYGAERLLRDSLVFPIYEGTSQIQALMATKDILMKTLKNPTEFAQMSALAKTQSLAARSSAKRKVAGITSLYAASIRHLITKIAVLKMRGIRGKAMAEWSHKLLKDWDAKKDFAPALLHAEKLIQLMAIKEISQILLSQSERHKEREDVLHGFLERNEAKAYYLHKAITSQGSRILDKLGRQKDQPKKGEKAYKDAARQPEVQ